MIKNINFKANIQENAHDLAVSNKKNIKGSIAYNIDVPADSANYMTVQKLGGMTRKCANLIPYPYDSTTQTQNGITFTDNKNGSFTLSGTATGQVEYRLRFNKGFQLPAGSYMLSGCPAGGSWTKYVLLAQINDTNYADFGNGVNITLTESSTVKLAFVIYLNASFSNTTIYPMLNEGATALPYEPYFEGLRDAKVTAVKSVGANLVDVSKAIDTVWYGSNIQRNGNDLVFTYGTSPNDYFAFSVWIDVEPNTNYFVSLKTTSIRFCYVYTDKLMGSIVTSFSTSNGVFNSGNNSKLLIGFYSIASSRTGTSENISDIMLNKGSTALPYAPYVEHTMPIPEVVQALDGYGLGVSTEYYNRIAWNEDNSKSLIKKVKGLDLGSLNWNSLTVAASGVRLFYCDDIKTTAYAPYYNKLNPFVSGKYANVSAEACSTIDKSISINNEGRIYVRDDSFTDVASFKASVVGVRFIYTLTTEEITDISDLITADNILGVEGNGIITFENEYGYAVPSEVTYYTGENEIVGAKTFVGDLIGTASRTYWNGIVDKPLDVALLYDAEVAAHQAYYDSMAHLCAAMGTVDNVKILAEDDTETHTDEFYDNDTYNCYVLPNGFTRIGECSFQYSSVKDIKFPPSLKEIAFCAFVSCSNLTKINIPRNVEAIGDTAFKNCTSLKTFTFEKGCKITKIEYNCFQNCTALTGIEIPENVTEIGDGAFAKCEGITTWNIPKNVTYIGNYAFDCGMDANIIFDLTDYGANTPFPTLGGYLFNTGSPNSCTIYVPNGRKAELSAMTNWSNFAAYMVEV